MKAVRKRSIGAAVRLLAAALVLTLGAGIADSIRAEDDAPRSRAPGQLEFKGKNFFATANGQFHEWRIVESQLDLSKPDECFAVIEVDLASVDTGIGRRDEHLRTEDFFDVESYPVATARGHSLVSAGRSAAGNPLFTAQFDIDLHGVRKTLSGEIEFVSEEPVIVDARLTMDRLEFDVGPPTSRWNPMSVKAEIPVSIRIEL